MDRKAPLGQGFINSNVLPPDEYEEAAHLHFLTILLPIYIHRFYDAMMILNHARRATDAARSRLENKNIIESERKTRSVIVEHYWYWPHLAGRDAAMTIYHFDIGLRSLLSSIHRCPTVKEMADYEMLKMAYPLFRKYFPDAVHLRNAVGHVAELVQTREHVSQNSVKGKGFAFEQVVGRTLYVTYKGKTITLEISEITLQKLNEVWTIVAHAMQKAIDAAEVKFQEKYPEAHALQQRLNQSS